MLPLPAVFNYQFSVFTNSVIVLADCFEWMQRIPDNSIHAIVTDPPFGIKEYDREQLIKRELGVGGVWRKPPNFDGHSRSPLPRFTALSKKDRIRLKEYYYEWGVLAKRILRPGGHVFLASNVYLSQIVFSSLIEAGFEFRDQIIRLVSTLRGGDRPKNAERQFPDVCTLPRGQYEPWGLFRKPLPNKMTVKECLLTYQTGGLRRLGNKPFPNVIQSQKTSKYERVIANHPNLKPQAFMRKIVWASLPLGEGIILDPFMGAGSTIAAAESIGYSAIGIEQLNIYFAMAHKAVPQLAKLTVSDFPTEL